MFSSSAPQDPIFFAMHGLAERFLQVREGSKERARLLGVRALS